jgi:hypothetical protein
VGRRRTVSGASDQWSAWSTALTPAHASQQNQAARIDANESEACGGIRARALGDVGPAFARRATYLPGPVGTTWTKGRSHADFVRSKLSSGRMMLGVFVTREEPADADR